MCCIPSLPLFFKWKKLNILLNVKKIFQQGLLKKHEAFETDFTVHRDRVSDVCANGEDLIKKVHNLLINYHTCQFEQVIQRRNRFWRSCVFPTEQPSYRQHQCQDDSAARKSVWAGESSSSEEGQAGWKLCLPTIQLEGWRGGILDRYENIDLCLPFQWQQTHGRILICEQPSKKIQWRLIENAVCYVDYCQGPCRLIHGA